MIAVGPTTLVFVLISAAQLVTTLYCYYSKCLFCVDYFCYVSDVIVCW